MKGQSLLFWLLILFICFNTPSIAQNIPAIAWDKTFGGNNIDQLNCMQQTSDDGFILGGSSYSGISGDKNQPNKGVCGFWIIKLDANGNKIWEKSLGGLNGEGLNYLQQTSDGGYICGGFSTSGVGGDKSQPSRGLYDYWIIKVDANGNKLWDKSFGGSNHDYITYLQQTSDGGYIISGNSESGISGDKTQSSRGGQDYWVLKLDVNGNKIWDKTFGGAKREYLSSLAETFDGGFILGGTTESGVSGDKTQPSKGLSDCWIIKIDSNGNKLWDKVLGGSSDDGLSTVYQSRDGGYFLGGHSMSGVSGDKSQPSKGDWDYWVIKLDSNGTKLWDKVYGGSSNEALRAMKPTSDGGIILSGESISGISGDKSQISRGFFDYWVVKVDSGGNKLWDRVLGSNSSERFCTAQQTSDGNYIVGGYTDSGLSIDKSQPSRGSDDYWIVKLIAPCSELTAKLKVECNNGNATISVDVTGIQLDSNSLPTYTLTYSINGITQTVSGNSTNLIVTNNAVPGTVYNLISIVSGSCTKVLTDSLTVKPVPGSPVVTPNSNCGSGSVRLIASGAANGEYYIWYDKPVGGKALFQSSAGVFDTPNLTETTPFYVALVSKGSCEGPRTQVTAIIKSLPIVAGPDEIICGNADTFQLKDYMPVGGTWSGPGVTVTGFFTPSNSLIGKQILTYSVVANGCVFSDTKSIEIRSCEAVIIPNIITPNHDTKNDTFKPQNLPEGKWHLQIYNRWGVKIYESKDYQNNWPEKEIANGTYYYLLSNPETGKQFKGWLEVTE